MRKMKLSFLVCSFPWGVDSSHSVCGCVDVVGGSKDGVAKEWAEELEEEVRSAEKVKT